MQRSKSLALMFLLGAVLVGGVLGFTADRMMVQDRLCEHETSREQVRARIAQELGLSATQRQALDSILDDRRRQFDQVMAPLRPRLDTARVQMDSIRLVSRDQIRQMLTADQRERFEAILKRTDERRAKENR